MTNKGILLFFVFVFLALGISSGLVITNVNSDNIAPGQEGRVVVTIKNNLNFDVKDVSMSLDFSNLPLSAVAGSIDTVDEIAEDEKEDFGFRIRADTNAKTGDYKIKYVINYKNASSPQTGTISVRIAAEPDMAFSVSAQNPIVGERGKIVFKMINKGLGEARFVSVRILDEGFNYLSEKEVYIGSVESDDFDTASFDVIFKSKNPTFSALVEYRNIDNVKIVKNVDLPLRVYTREEAIKQGIIQKSKTWLYAFVVLVVLIFWMIWRAIKKRSRLKKSREAVRTGGN